MAEVLPSDDFDLEPSGGALRPGMRLGRYELLVPIARGGMARVWAARQHGQRGFQKLVALKTILPHLARTTEFERMFLDEARIASGVHHPNVCEIYELGDEGGTLYLAMEWVSGDSFARLLRARDADEKRGTEAIDPRVAARIVADACAGTHAAHELTDEATGRLLGVVHRDLSPHNVLLTADGVAKVADFGVAKARGQLHEATSRGELKGKIAFMSPEQVTNAPIDRRSDVFSLGVVLYEAITGVRPFRGDGDHQIMHALLKGEVQPPSAVRRTVPPDLEKIVLRALSPEPIRRFPTAERMRFALEEFLAKGQIVTHAQVAQVVRARLGDVIEKRKEQIRRASTAPSHVQLEEALGPGGSMTPSNQGPQPEHHSGVKQAQRSLGATLSLGAPGTVPAAWPMPPRTSSSPGMVSPVAPQAPSTQPPPALQRTIMIGEVSPFVPPAPDTAPVLEPSRAPGVTEASGAFPRPAPSGGGDDTRWGPANFRAPQPPVSQPSMAPMPSTAPMHPPLSIHGVPMGAPATEQKPQGAGSYAVAIGIGLVIALLLGGGGFLAFRTSKRPEDLTPRAPLAAASNAPSAVASVASAAPSSSPSAAPAQVPSPTIVFQLTPAEATLTVDGKDLAPDARTVPRPPAGKNVTVVAKAKGHEDVTILVDALTSSPMEITLTPADGDKAEAAPAAPKKPKKKEADPALPANPY